MRGIRFVYLLQPNHLSLITNEVCGIFAYIGKNENAAQVVLEGLKRLEYRGYDSWGIAVKESDRIEFATKKQIGKIGDATVNDLPKSHFGFGHTRWATHGGVTQENSHPHTDCTKIISIIHNGIIENYEMLKTRLQKNNHTFISQTDTEVAAHLIEEFVKSYSFSQAVRHTFNLFDGLNAIIVTKADEQKFIAVRNGSPLVIGFGEGENFIASDAAALLPHTRTVYFMEENEMAEVRKNIVTIRDLVSGKKIIVKKMHLTWKVDDASRGTFKHFMRKEIEEQPKMIMRIAQTKELDVNLLATKIKSAKQTFIVGCGTASYAAIAGTYLFSKIAKRNVAWLIGSEFAYQADFVNRESLLIALSQSGETIDTLEAVKKAKAKGAIVASLVNVEGSSLYRESDLNILLDAGPEKAVASTKAFSAKIAHLILTAYALQGEIDKGKAVLFRATSASTQVLSESTGEKIKKIVHSLMKDEHIYIIGRGLSYPVSLETALKIKEISYIHAEGFAAGELKHGVIALATKGTPCIAFLPNDETYGANLAGAMEMKARGGRIIGISSKSHEVFDEYIEVPDAAEATIIPNVIVAQLLAYELAVLRGYDPDMPRNLAKSVTVK